MQNSTINVKVEMMPVNHGGKTKTIKYERVSEWGYIQNDTILCISQNDTIINIPIDRVNLITITKTQTLQIIK